MNDVSNLTDRHNETTTEHDRTGPKAGRASRGDSRQQPVSGLATGALPETDGAIAPGPPAGQTIEGVDLTSRENQVEEDLLYLTGLVFGRAILEQRGAGNAELAWMTSEITKLRTRLAGERHGISKTLP